MGVRLRFTNFYEHNDDTRFMVYEFFETEHADYFESLLKDRKVDFERYLDESAVRKVILFGIDKRYLDKSDQSNYLTHAHFRNHIIKNIWWRWIFMIVMGVVIIIAAIGYYKVH